MAPDREIQQMQDAADAMTAELAGRSVGQVAAVLATDPRFRPLLEVPAFIEWVATEISSGRRPAIEPQPEAPALRTLVRNPGPTPSEVITAVETSDDATWTDNLERVLATGGVVSFLQPIVDLRTRAVVGYEALARFSDPAGHTPAHWFAQAAKHGMQDELEALATRAALDRLPECPRGCFLAINVSPQSLGSDPVVRALAQAGHLQGVVVELTADSYPSDLSGLTDQVEALKAAGARLAVSYVAERTTEPVLAAIRPSVVKLPQPLIAQRRLESGDEDTGAELAQIAGPFGTRLLAQNVEHAEDLVGLERVGIKMVQGFAFGVPTTSWHPLASEIELTIPPASSPE